MVQAINRESEVEGEIERRGVLHESTFLETAGIVNTPNEETMLISLICISIRAFQSMSS